METIKGPVTVGGNLFFGLSAVMEHKGRMIVVVAETVGDIRDAWEAFQLDTPTLPDLDETLLQRVVIGLRDKINA